MELGKANIALDDVTVLDGGTVGNDHELVAGKSNPPFSRTRLSGEGRGLEKVSGQELVEGTDPLLQEEMAQVTRRVAGIKEVFPVRSSAEDLLKWVSSKFGANRHSIAQPFPAEEVVEVDRARLDSLIKNLLEGAAVGICSALKIVVEGGSVVLTINVPGKDMLVLAFPILK